MFWGVTLESGKRYSQVVDTSYHLSMAALEPTTKEVSNKYVMVMLEHGKSEFLLCTLEYDRVMQVRLDLFFVEGEEVSFFLNGEGTVHLTGYVTEDLESNGALPDDDEEFSEVDDEEEDDEEEEVPALSLLADDDEDEEEDDEDYTPMKEKKQLQQLEKKRKRSSLGDPNNMKHRKTGSSDDAPEVVELSYKDEDSRDDEEESEDEEGEESSENNESDDTGDEESDEEPSDDSLDEAQLEHQKQQMKKQQKKKRLSNSEGNSTPVMESPSAAKKSPLQPSSVTNDSNKMIESQENVTPGSLKKKKKKRKSQGLNQITPEANKASTGNLITPPKGSLKKAAGDVKYEDLRIGNGPPAKQGKIVHVYYVGKLANNKVFDSTQQGKPFSFKLGKGDVIPGWEIGLEGMKVGGKRKLVIPPSQGYGSKRIGPIPPNSTLYFDVELKAVT